MDIQKYINEYLVWLKSEITYSTIGEYCEINVPFLDNNNDYLQFYVKFENGEVYFTDDGQTINELEMSGLKFTSARSKQLKYIISQYGVQLLDNEFFLKAPVQEFAKKKHAFIQCLLKVNDMYMLSRSRVASTFMDDVIDFFEKKEIYPIENVQFVGTSGFSHNYDFVLQRTKNNPERMCLAVNNATKTNVGNIIFSWNDTKTVRKNESRLIVLMNDNNNVGKGVDEALQNYDIKTVMWSERERPENLSLLSA